MAKKFIFIILILAFLSPAAILKSEEGMEKRISLNLRNIDAIESLQYLAKEANLNIAINKGVSGRVTLNVTNVPIKDIWDIILLTNSLAYYKQGDIYYVMTGKDYETIYGKKFEDARCVRMIRLNYAVPERAFKLLDALKSTVGRLLVDEESGTVLILDTPENLEKMQKSLAYIEGKNVVEVFSLQYAKAKDVEERLKTQLSLKKAGSIVADERTNQVIVETLPGRMEEIRRLIKNLDEPTKQVLIMARVVKVNFTKGSEMSVQWEGLLKQITPTGVEYIGSHPLDSMYRIGRTAIDQYAKIEPTAILPALPKVTPFGEVYLAKTGEDNFEAVFKFLQTLGKAQLLSSPKLAVVNSEEAYIHVGTKEVYVTTTTSQAEAATTLAEEAHFIDVGIKLKVTPTINDEGYITMKINPEISSVISWYETPSGNRIPVVDTALTETRVMVKDGTTIIIGGLRKKVKSSKTTRVPILGQIPLLGKLFSSETAGEATTELIIFLTPHIISGGELVTGEKEVQIEPLTAERGYLEKERKREESTGSSYRNYGD